jgi:hypothetical protein
VAGSPISTPIWRGGASDFSLRYALDRWGLVRYTVIGTRKSFVRDRRDVAVRFLRAYVDVIHAFKTRKELALNTLKKYARMSDISLMNET